MKPAGRFVAGLCLLGMLANAANAAETASVREYAFELVTLNLGDKVRRRQSGAQIQIDIASAMTDDEIETVKSILDRLQASQPDEAGYRQFTMPNGTRVRIGGFIEDAEVAGAAVQSLPVEFAVRDEFSAVEAALVLRIATAANLFVGNPDEPTVVATTYPVTDRPFRKEHPRASFTPDDNSLADWVRQNIPAREVPSEPAR
jgi:hypothetical protein